MPSQNTSDIKEKIIYWIKMNGPTIPVYVAKEIQSSILFTSAFLSELSSEKRLKVSHMRIGNSPLYFVEGQEYMLENFSSYLKSKEKEAFVLLKEKKFLKDSEQEPAIRVALRQIKDFAIPFKRNEEIIWRFFNVPEIEFVEEKKPTAIPTLPIVLPVKTIEEKTKTELQTISEEVKEIKKEKKRPKPKIKTTRKKAPLKAKHDEAFLAKIKEFLSKNSTEILNIEGIKKDELILRVKVNSNEQLLIAYKKRKITEKEIMKAAKKAAELKLKYSVLSMGELPKKISDLIEALQNIKDIKKIE